MTEVWTIGAGVPKAGARLAERLEQQGWTGLLMVDSQNLVGDCFVGLAMAAKSTSSLLLGTGVTNPWTRHPAVMASAIATVQAESDGRAVLGIGRGDSALAHLGYAPAPVSRFRAFLEAVQGYLRGEDVAFAGDGNVASLGLAGTPPTSRLHWLRPSMPKVPVDVAATGPKVIALGAEVGDRVTFAVGAEPERVAWALESARVARGDGASWGCYVNCVVDPDPAVARELGEGGLASFARFSVMHGSVAGPVDDAERAVLERLHDAYDMRVHTQARTPQAQALTPEFAERFGIFGPADYCLARLRELVDLGIERLVIIGTSLGADRARAQTATERFSAEVLPALTGG